MLERIGKLRDGILVIASIVYLLGYIVWSFNARKNNLGLLPVVEFQYFAAGSVPALIGYSVYIAIINFKRFRGKFIDWCVTEKNGWKLFLYTTFTVFCLHLIAITIKALQYKNLTVASVCILVSVIIIIFLILATLGARLSLQWYTSFLAYFNFIFLPTMGLLTYIYWVYPKLPQEFAGPHARCAYLDVVREQMSDETRTAIISPDANNSKALVVRSKEVDVFFIGKEFILVRPPMEKQEVKPTMYEIRKDVLKAITWCGQSGQ